MKTNCKNRLIVMIGLPQSGKSFESMQMKSPIVNRDAIRKTIGGSIRYYKEEDRVTEIERIMAESLFNAGHDEVIIDACHLKPKYRNAWKTWTKNLDIDIHFYHVLTSLETCMTRARRNYPDEPKFPAIIKSMWEHSDISDTCDSGTVWPDGTMKNQIPELQKDWW